MNYDVKINHLRAVCNCIIHHTSYIIVYTSYIRSIVFLFLFEGIEVIDPVFDFFGFFSAFFA
jgi:hypothetical protein